MKQVADSCAHVVLRCAVLRCALVGWSSSSLGSVKHTRLVGSLPPLLILQLKRFGQISGAATAFATGGLDTCRTKSHARVEVPMELVSQRPYPPSPPP